MKLHAFDPVFLVPQAHDKSVSRSGRNLQALGQTLPFYHQGMIARCLESIGKALENGPVIVANLAGLAMHQVRSWDNLPAKSLADGLMTEADSENGLLPFKSLEQLERDAGLIGISGSG